MTSAAKQPSFDMVVIGGTGDLARRKLLPALYILHKHGEISDEGRIFAVSRQQETREDFLAGTGERARGHVEAEELDDEAWRKFAERLHYLSMSATDPDTYGELRRLLAAEPERVRIFYLATPPQIYGAVSRAIDAAGLCTPKTRIVLEKPIGHDLASAREINAAVGRFFAESQIYRIDHYLGKETVQNLMALRFGNALFEPLWRSEHVDHVQITVAESIGIEDRGGYYDHTGALRDMVQNHLLQLLCLTAMEPPARLEQDAIRDEKIKVLRSLRPITAREVDDKTVRGQYQKGAIDGETVAGYLKERDVAAESSTDTFVAIKAEIDNWRWAGVPFYLRTGKRMSRRVSEIVLQFKRVPHVLFASQARSLHRNRLVIRLQPEEFIKLGLMTKTPGPAMDLRREFLNLNLAESVPGVRRLLAYERLLLDILRGVTTLFMHRQEVEEAWSWIDQIVNAWDENHVEPRYYDAGTWGPTESVALVVQDGRRWYEHLT